MIDIHCHILPYIDDGPKNYDEALDMAKGAVEAGITHLYATPHHFNGRFENQKDKIIENVAIFNDKLQKENIPLIIHLGQELRIHREIFLTYELDEILTLDNKGKYLLLELPSFEVPTYTHEVIYELLLKGITPIIVHPERNKGFIQDFDELIKIVQGGALTQITSGSLIGHFGKKVKSFSQKIIEQQLAHFIATDAHSTITRRFSLQESYNTISNLYGMQQMYYFKENAEILLNGDNLSIEKPKITRKKILGLF
ncbi:CpsB/CapC family capsule biosynthesis tyrosine phosphatase [Heyndrickxia sp. FSL K6-6286]|uniref:tyrosine-protein phosphatase n=1 Tax=Heyndrickxia sp. FSL K6-6286 TaxID=2921510 RepID=UPI00315B05CF